jgi:hypothetical protein
MTEQFMRKRSASQVREDYCALQKDDVEVNFFHAKDDAKAKAWIPRAATCKEARGERGNFGHPVAVNRDKYMLGSE